MEHGNLYTLHPNSTPIGFSNCKQKSTSICTSVSKKLQRNEPLCLHFHRMDTSVRARHISTMLGWPSCQSQLFELNWKISFYCRVTRWLHQIFSRGQPNRRGEDITGTGLLHFESNYLNNTIPPLWQCMLNKSSRCNHWRITKYSNWNIPLRGYYPYY